MYIVSRATPNKQFLGGGGGGYVDSYLDDSVGSFMGSVTPTRIDGSPSHSSRYESYDRIILTFLIKMVNFCREDKSIHLSCQIHASNSSLNRRICGFERNIFNDI